MAVASVSIKYEPKAYLKSCQAGWQANYFNAGTKSVMYRMKKKHLVSFDFGGQFTSGNIQIHFIVKCALTRKMIELERSKNKAGRSSDTLSLYRSLETINTS